MDFEFDPTKNATNKVKHGIDFVEAQKLWEDRDRLLIPAITEDEARFILIGKFPPYFRNVGEKTGHTNCIRTVFGGHYITILLPVGKTGEVLHILHCGLPLVLPVRVGVTYEQEEWSVPLLCEEGGGVFSHPSDVSVSHQIPGVDTKVKVKIVPGSNVKFAYEPRPESAFPQNAWDRLDTVKKTEVVPIVLMTILAVLVRIEPGQD